MGVKWCDFEEETTRVGERKVRDLPKVKWEIKDNDNK